MSTLVRTEKLLTSRDGFGLETATPAQRAACRILDGAPLGELGKHPDVAELVGGTEALGLIDGAPTEVVLLAAIRAAKTMIACAAAIRMALTVDVEKLKAGELPRVSIVSPKLDTSAVAKSLLAETIKASAVLRPLMIGDPTADVMRIRHPTGWPIEIACVAGSRAGTGLVSRWAAGVIFDEAPRMTGAEDGVINLDHARTAAIGRLLPGAQILYVGSPWAPTGPVYDMVQEHWGAPSSRVAVLRGTGPMLNPVWWTEERCAKVQEQDPDGAYVTDVLGEFAAPEAGLLDQRAITECTRDVPLELAPNPRGSYCAACDPSEGSATGNAWTLVIVQVHPEPMSPLRMRFAVAAAREYRGQRPTEIWKQIAAVCKDYGLTKAFTDQYAAASNADIARSHGLTLEIEASTGASKVEDYGNLATLVHTKALELAPSPVMRRDLLSIRKRRTQTGYTIVLPKTGDGRHCDYAPALVAACKHASLPMTGTLITNVTGLREANPRPMERMRRPV